MTNPTTITADAALSMDRFAFIALFLVVRTRKADDRTLVGGYQVRFAGGEYRIVSTTVAAGVVVYRTRDAGCLFDYARRGKLGYLTRRADEWRMLAFEMNQKAAA